jgi:hypothetical protein
MDEPLFRAWSDGLPPFDGVTLRSADLVPLELLFHMLSETIGFLREKFPEAKLLRHDDWHEHDGYITSSVPTDWGEVSGLITSATALYEQRPGDDFVRIGIYEPQGAFYLRIGVPDEDDDPELYPGRWGMFDVSAAEPLIAELKSVLRWDGLETSDTMAYFNERSAR